MERTIVNFLNKHVGGNFSPEAFEVFREFVKFLSGRQGTLELVVEFFNSKGWANHAISDINAFYEFAKYLNEPKELKKYRVALLFICLNEPYWQYIKPVIDGARQFLLPGHDTDIFLWSDIPAEQTKDWGIKEVFPTEPLEWPMPTLLRYHLFLQQEEKLKDYDYIFYCDADMKFVNYVGDEILGADLTAAQHPGYALSQRFWIPYDPNPESEAHIPRPGKVIFDPHTGQNKFMPLFYAGGFQGGTRESFIKSWKVMSEKIDKDLDKNYMALWNDQAHWNNYLWKNPPSVVLSPSYIYPDSLINEYYIPIWGTNYPPKIITLTKPFTLQKLSEKELKELNMKA